MHAARYGQIEVLQRLLSTGQVEINARDDAGDTALIFAVRERNGARVKMLLDEDNVNPNVQNNEGWTALMLAAYFDFRQEYEWKIVMQYLLARKDVLVNVSNVRGETALMLAARQGWKLGVKLLLDRDDVDPNGQDEQGLTALMLAACGGPSATVALLIEKGADVSIVDDRGYTAEMYAANAGHGGEEIRRLFRRRDHIDAAREETKP